MGDDDLTRAAAMARGSRRPAASCGSSGSGRCSIAGNPPATPTRPQATPQTTAASAFARGSTNRATLQTPPPRTTTTTTTTTRAGRISLPRVVVVEERRDHPDPAASSSSSWSPMTPEPPPHVPRGCCAVYVGGAERRRFVVPTAYLGDPVFARLLEKAEEEFGFDYSAGAGITIPCDTEAFKYILRVMDAHRRGLLDDEGNPKEHREEGGEASETR